MNIRFVRKLYVLIFIYFLFSCGFSSQYRTNALLQYVALLYAVVLFGVHSYLVPLFLPVLIQMEYCRILNVSPSLDPCSVLFCSVLFCFIFS
jgi:hypothetical protein